MQKKMLWLLLKIHPFQDCNGRIIIFKECLKNGIDLIIIDA